MVEAKTSRRAYAYVCAGVNMGRAGGRVGVIRARMVTKANRITHIGAGYTYAHADDCNWVRVVSSPVLSTGYTIDCVFFTRLGKFYKSNRINDLAPAAVDSKGVSSCHFYIVTSWYNSLILKDLAVWRVDCT